jgi:hypothetical protein
MFHKIIKRDAKDKNNLKEVFTHTHFIIGNTSYFSSFVTQLTEYYPTVGDEMNLIICKQSEYPNCNVKFGACSYKR